MPRRTDIESVLVIGSGPIVIGQACEFDYSGTQACKALREEGYRVVLVNSNPATIMTDPEMADRTYVEPMTVASVEQIASGIREVLEPHAQRLEILAEPGRIMVAESMMLVTSVAGVAERGDGRWYYVDDGLYGSYSNVLTEDVHPLVFAERDLRDRHADTETHRWATLGGPTCDSSDVIAREVMLPDLVVGDLLVSPVMGAYTTVTATRFNGRALTPVAVVGRAPSTGQLAAVATPGRLTA